MFDQFVPANFGSVNDNGWTSFRTAFEFGLADLPSGSTVSAATLTFMIGSSEGSRSIAAHGYAGDGIVDLADFSRDGLGGIASFDPGIHAFDFDVTDLVRTWVSQNATYAGFNVREAPPNTANFLVMQVDMYGPISPQLRIDYASSGGAARLERHPGSPFVFFGSGGGSSQVPVLAPDGRHLYVSSVGAGDIIAFNLAEDGAPGLIGRFPSAPPTSMIGGMALSSAGDRLYAVALDQVDLHFVAPTGELSAPGSFSAQVAWSNPVNGVAYVPLAGGDFLYVNDNATPNTVSAWRIGPGGAPEFVAAYPTGGSAASATGQSLIAAPHLATFGGRLFALDAPPRGSLATATVAVFDVGPDGALTHAPGSPFDLGSGSASIALHPSGAFLYAGGAAGNVLELAVAPDGRLELVADATVAGMTGKPNGLAVDPSGRWLAFSATAGGRIAVVDTGTLAPIENGVQPDALVVDGSFTSLAAGLAFDGAGRLYVGHTGGTPIISVYQVVAGAAPLVTCVGTPGEPVVLPADATSCAVSVDPSNGLAGSCADGGGGLASCRFDGSEVLLLAPGPRAIAVVAQAPGGATASCTSYVFVADVTPPLVLVSPSPGVLWPPNHLLVPVDTRAGAQDACDGTVVPTCSAASSEPDEALGDGSTGPDIVWGEGGTLWLRAERVGAGPGRVYTLTCEAADGAGNLGRASATVLAPHDLD
ncbi:MAG TPA: hypothetical protein VFR85_05805 [Anaeromyxobacteraceae bacterium]|nr:hypothetical protein [Anaeromyxobacteraceae bacterium]